jgi:hypothetical protein
MTAGWLTVRELDRRAGRPKGTAFRAFRQLEPQLREGEHFCVLQPERDAAQIDALRAGGRIYPSSRTVVLLAPAVAARILERMTAP